jgi:subtilisin family serine protease
MIKTGKLLILSAGNNSQDIDFNSSFGAIRRLANCNEYEGAVIIVGACYLKEDGGDLWRDSCRPGDIYASTTSNGFENAKKEQSSTGSIADHYITAPGVYIKSTIAGNKFKDQSGTSFAAPMVAGAACLLWEKYPHWTAVQVKKAILNSASPFSEFPSKFQWAKRCRVEHEEENGITIPYAPNFSEYYGKGMLNIKAMFELAATLSEYQYT